MKPFIVILVFISFIQYRSFCHGLEISEKSFLGEKTYLEIKPILDDGEQKETKLVIPIVVTNEYTEAINVMLPGNRINGLVISNKYGEKVDIDAELLGRAAKSGAISPVVCLKPGESGTFESVSSLDAATKVANQGLDIYAEVTGRVAGSNQAFLSYSPAFHVPLELVKQPWIDLGEKKYFSLTPVMTNGFIFGGNIHGRILLKDPQYRERLKDIWGEYLAFPVKIVNSGEQPFVAAVDYVRFYITRTNSGRIPPSPRDSLRDEPILKPGDVSYSSGRCYIRISTLEAEGYKEGDQIVASIGGRIPDSNQVFECYSEPFELPLLPAGHSMNPETKFDQILKDATKVP